MPGIKGDVSVIEPSRAEATLARRSAETRATVPDLEFSAEADVSAVASAGGVTPALMIHACALALRAVPRANAAYRDGRFELYSRVNVGIALNTAEAIVIPTVFDADQKPPSQLEAELLGLRERASSGQLTASELSGATFTLYEMSELGVRSATPLVIAPQAAAIASGAVRELPRIKDGAIVAAATMTLTLACDGRIMHGAHAARFLDAVRVNLEQAEL